MIKPEYVSDSAGKLRRNSWYDDDVTRLADPPTGISDNAAPASYPVDNTSEGTIMTSIIPTWDGPDLPGTRPVHQPAYRPVNTSAVNWEGTPVAVAAAATEHARRTWEQLRSQARSLEEVQAFGRDFAGTPAARSADQAIAAVAERRQAVQDQRGSQRAGMTVPADEQLAAARVWPREKAIWDAADPGKAAAAIVNRLGSATPAERRVLAEEAGPYCQARGIDPAIVEAALIKADPELSKATDLLNTYDKALALLQQNRNSLHRSYQRGTPTSPPIAVPAAFDPDRA
jgi:hypothetical protein